MFKTCSKCRIEKPRTEFGKHKTTLDGLRCYCKECVKILSKLPKYKEASKRAGRNFYERNKIKRNEYYKNYRKTENGKEIIKKHCKKQRENGIAKIWDKVHRTLKKEPCVVCGNPKTHAHHEDYNKPLDVIWLCPKHHRDIHRGALNLNDRHGTP